MKVTPELPQDLSPTGNPTFYGIYNFVIHSANDPLKEVYVDGGGLYWPDAGFSHLRLAWGSCLLYDKSLHQSVDWDNRWLQDATGNATLRWSLGAEVSLGRLTGNMDTMTYANPISLDVAKGNLHKTTTTSGVGNSTINASAAGTAGQHIWVLVLNDASANRTITFGTNFKPSATVVGTTSKAAIVQFVSDGINWYEVARTLGL